MISGKFKKWIKEFQAWAKGHEYVYDIECYPNIFTCRVWHVKTLQKYHFELSPWFNNMRDFNDFLYYLHVNDCWMIGFNNFHYDWPVVSAAFYAMPGGVTNRDIYGKSYQIIHGDYEDRFNHVVWPSDQFVKQIDLLKICHYDNPAKRTSLKMLENNMGMENIQDLPITPGVDVTLEQRNELIPYNDHDVFATYLKASRCIAMIDLRLKLSDMFGTDLLNASEAKIGQEIIKHELKKAGLPVSQKTPRQVIHFSDCIFSYVGFERPEFIELLNWIKGKSITKTKECLNDIEVPYSLARYMNPNEVFVCGLPQAVLDEMKLRKNQKVKLSLVPLGESLEGCKFIASHLHVVVDGFQFDLGTGGIHGSIESAIVRTTETHELVDIDVEGYYPGLGIKNQLYPQHLGPAFPQVQQEIKNLRAQYNKKTHPMENKAFKLAGNAAYGNSNNQHSFLFDPQYTMTITLNGQLLLCMLAEQLLKVPGLSIIQANTDGITYHVPKVYKDHTMSLCRWWEGFTKLTLEDVTYSAMYIRDVNNYIAVPLEGDPKFKGAYEYDLEATGQWHKNFSSLIIAMAAEQALLHGVDIEDYIMSMAGNHETRFLFCMREKVDRSARLVFERQGCEPTELQRVTRYYASVDGGDLIKIMKPTQKQIDAFNFTPQWVHVDSGKTKISKKRPSGKWVELDPSDPRYQHERPENRQRVEATCKITPCNDMRYFCWENLDIDYYIKEAHKLVDPLL